MKQAGQFWSAVTCHRFESADMSAQSKSAATRGGAAAPPYQQNI
jgi:hypothetical protein